MTMITEQFSKCRKVGVPLVAIETPDQNATIQRLINLDLFKEVPALQWDLIRGIQPLNEAGRTAIDALGEQPEELAMRTGNPAEAFDIAKSLPPASLLFAINAHRVMGSEAPSQAVFNLRDIYKSNQRMLVLLGPAFQFAAELQRDIIILSEPLPSDEDRKTQIGELFTDNNIPIPSDEEFSNIVKATRGLAHFPTEQVTALAMNKAGVDVASLWGYKQKMIEASKGLSLLQPKETFDDIGGIDQAKFFGSRIFKGNAAPSAVVFMDEIEKSMSGSGGGDLSGISQDFLGVILSAMEDNLWTGLIAVGPPGCAKSFYAKTLGASNDVPVLQFDMGALKGSLVGQSETAMRECIKTIQAVAGEGAFFVATCNKLDALPPELRRRFRLGIWFFDLPDETERKAIWDICRKKYSIAKDDKTPKAKDWTGADIRNCCEVAWRLGLSLVEAAQFITPVSQSDPESIAKLRKMADNRFLSASYPGTFQLEKSSGKRKIQVVL